MFFWFSFLMINKSVVQLGHPCWARCCNRFDSYILPTSGTKQYIGLTQLSNWYKHHVENVHRHKHKHLHTICVKFEHQRDILWSFHIKTNIQTRTRPNGLKLNYLISRSTNLETIQQVRNQVQMWSVNACCPLAHTETRAFVCVRERGIQYWCIIISALLRWKTLGIVGQWEHMHTCTHRQGNMTPVERCWYESWEAWAVRSVCASVYVCCKVEAIR